MTDQTIDGAPSRWWLPKLRAPHPRREPRPGPAPLLAGYLASKDENNRWRRATRYGLTFVFITFYAFLVLLLPRQLLLLFLMPLLVLYVFVIWAMPATNRAPSKWLDWLFWAHFVSLFLWPNYLALTIPGLPWITFARIVGVPLMMLLIFYASTSIPFKQQIAKSRASAPAMFWLIIGFSILQFVSIGMSDSPFVTVNRVFNNMITWTATYFAAIWVFRDVKRIENWIVGYVALAFVLCLMAVAESINGGVLWANSVPSFLKPPDQLVDKILEGSYRLTGQYRVQATQTTPLSLAEMLSLTVPLLFYVVNRYPRLWVFVAAAAVDVLIIYVLLLADARLGFVSLILGHMLALLYFGIERWRWSRGSLLGPSITMLYPALGLAALGAVLFVGRIRVRVLGSGQHQGSNDAREEQWRLGLAKIWESPILGFGADRGGDAVGYRSPNGLLTIDSYYLSILMDYGFFGFLLFYGMFIYAIVIAAQGAARKTADTRLIYACFGIFLLEFLVIKSVLAQVANHPLLFMAFGAVVAICARSTASKSISSR